jgi:tetraacyldisaccharide-1-P 4'-kinase
MLLTTEKDAVRLPEIPESPPLFALQLSIEISDPERFFGDIRRLIEK